MNASLDSSSVARYLSEHTDFFIEHAELLAQIRLISPLGGRTLSLQERQMEVLREKIKVVELRMADLARIAEENAAIAQKFQSWTNTLLLTRNNEDLPHNLIASLKTTFSVPYATLRLWDMKPGFANAWFAQTVSTDSRIFSNSLSVPFCGENQQFEAASWLDDKEAIRSIAMLPLRLAGASGAFGLLVLGSPDINRFTRDMATDFLMKISDVASTALTCLLD